MLLVGGTDITIQICLLMQSSLYIFSMHHSDSTDPSYKVVHDSIFPRSYFRNRLNHTLSPNEKLMFSKPQIVHLKQVSLFQSSGSRVGKKFDLIKHAGVKHF